MFVCKRPHAWQIDEKESLEMMRTLEDGMGCGIFELPFYDGKPWGTMEALMDLVP